jgi:hypothetical protein
MLINPVGLVLFMINILEYSFDLISICDSRRSELVASKDESHPKTPCKLEVLDSTRPSTNPSAQNMYGFLKPI